MLKKWLFSKIVKPILATTFYREGSIRSIVWGPCRGLRYRIFPGYGMSPLYGGWERDVQQIICKSLCYGYIAYDIGANFGIHTLLMARLVGNTGHVYAFEPVPKIRNWLQDNISINKFSNVTCLDFAISDCNGHSDFHVGHHRGAGHLITKVNQTSKIITVPTRTIDELVFEKKQRPPEFIKIDVEGAESKVLAGAAQTIKVFHPVLLIELHNPEQDLAVGNLLKQHSYVAFRTHDGTRVQDLTKGWPDKNGLWGQIVAYYAKLNRPAEHNNEPGNCW